MNKKDKDVLGSAITILVIGILFGNINKVSTIFPFLKNGIVYFLFSIIVGTIVGVFFMNLIPTKKQTKRNTSSKKKTSNKPTKVISSTKTSTKINNNKHSLLHSDREILTLPFNRLTWKDFERLCYLYYKAKGYKPRETSEGADGGVDLIIYNRHHQADVAIQIKHYQKGKQITVKEIRELATAKKNHKCMLADFITTSTFTNAALVEADKFNIECRQKEWVENKILRWRDQAAKQIS